MRSLRSPRFPQPLLVCGVFCGFVLGCGRADGPITAASSASAASASSSASATSPVSSAAPKPSSRAEFIPEGPILTVLPGRGLGPLRFGANLETVRRHMGVGCDVQTEAVCRMWGRAVEFQLENGVVEKITVHRKNRPAGNTKSGAPIGYGMFNGAIPPDVMMGMKVEAVKEVMGPPEREEQVREPSVNGTQFRLFYRGIVLEFDLFEGARVPVLSGMIITRPPAGVKPWDPDTDIRPREGATLRKPDGTVIGPGKAPK